MGHNAVLLLALLFSLFRNVSFGAWCSCLLCLVEGGVGFDINCGVRLLRTNLDRKDVEPVKEQIAQSLFDHIPVGVGSKGVVPMTAQDLEEALEMGMDWSLREG